MHRRLGRARISKGFHPEPLGILRRRICLALIVIVTDFLLARVLGLLRKSLRDTGESFFRTIIFSSGILAVRLAVASISRSAWDIEAGASMTVRRLPTLTSAAFLRRAACSRLPANFVSACFLLRSGLFRLKQLTLLMQTILQCRVLSSARTRIRYAAVPLHLIYSTGVRISSRRGKEMIAALLQRCDRDTSEEEKEDARNSKPECERAGNRHYDFFRK